MTARENEIGHCRCPVCANTKARLRVSSKQLAYVHCDACNSQIFARSDRGDAALRAMHIKQAEPQAEPTTTTTAEPVKPDAPAPAPAPKKPAFTWGAFPNG
jgi:hypothetical protein